MGGLLNDTAKLKQKWKRKKPTNDRLEYLYRLVFLFTEVKSDFRAEGTKLLKLPPFVLPNSLGKGLESQTVSSQRRKCVMVCSETATYRREAPFPQWHEESYQNNLLPDWLGHSSPWSYSWGNFSLEYSFIYETPHSAKHCNSFIPWHLRSAELVIELQMLASCRHQVLLCFVQFCCQLIVWH